MGAIPYVAIGLLTAIEGGEVALFTAGYLIGTGEMMLWPTIVLVTVSLFLGDMVWYLYGSRLYHLPGIRVFNNALRGLDGHIKDRPFLVALCARFSYGLHHPLIARYRENGIGTATMARILATTGLMWLCVLGGLVIFLAEYTTEIRQYLRYVEYAFALAFVAFIAVEYTITRAVRKRL